jgi:membrane protease subunit (stomatin/prohibitin family)
MVKFEVFTAVRMMMFFWNLAPCRLAGRCRFGKKTYVSVFSLEYGGSMFLRNTGIYLRVYGFKIQKIIINR